MSCGIVWSAFLLDLLLGDPHWLPHPVRGIGWAVDRMEAWIRGRARGPRALRMGGCFLVIGIVSGTFLLTWLILFIAAWMDSWLGLILSILLAYTTLAVKDLYRQSWAVARALGEGELDTARHLLSRIVGRDTDRLDAEGVLRAVIETVAENISDGIVAPLFYLGLGGVPAAMAYKAASTLDSMVGYDNDRYRQLGWCAARLDDILNFVPARLTALLLVAAAFLLRVDARGAWRILWRDGAKHKSPNAGRPEAAMAGALGVQLGGPSEYEGRKVEKPFLGDGIRPLNLDRVAEAEQLLFLVSLLMVFLVSFIRI